VARKLKVPRSTLNSGIDREEIPYVVTACGAILVTIQDCRAWLKLERKPGRKV